MPDSTRADHYAECMRWLDEAMDLETLAEHPAAETLGHRPLLLRRARLLRKAARRPYWWHRLREVLVNPALMHMVSFASQGILWGAAIVSHAPPWYFTFLSVWAGYTIYMYVVATKRSRRHGSDDGPQP